MNLTGIILAGGKSSRFGLNKLKIKVDSVPLFMDQIFKLSFFCDEIIISTSKSHYPIVFSELNKIKIYQKKYNFEKIQTSNPKIDFKDFLKRVTKPLNIKIILDESSYSSAAIKSSLNITNPGEFKSDYDRIGPIIGIYSSLINAVYFYSIIVAFDMPFISYNLLKSLIYESGVNIKKISTDKSVTISNYSRKKDAYIIKSEKGFEVLCGLYSKGCIDILKENIKKQKYKISDIFTYLDIEIISSKKLESFTIDNLNFFNINLVPDYHKFKNIWQNKKIALGTKNSFTEAWNDFFFR